MQKRMNVLKILNMDSFYMNVHVLLHLLNEMRKIDNV